MGLEFKPEIVELTDDELLREIRAFERTYGMSSEQFLERFNRGQLGHCTDFIDWAGLLDVAYVVGARAPMHT
jgi:hypothetical protein